ncbi:solute carrier family 35 member F6, partial [Pelomyxa schiedti]
MGMLTTSDTTRSKFVTLGLAAAMLVCGCGTTITLDVIDATESPGWQGDVHLFSHPWIQTLFMFIGESLAVGFALYQIGERMREQNKATFQYEMVQKPTLLNRARVMLNNKILAPTLLDLLSSALGCIGLLYCAASIWQMLRGSVVIFAAIISVILKQRQRSYRWIAVGITLVGIVVAGLTDILNTAFADRKPSSSSSSYLHSVAVNDQLVPEVYQHIFGIVIVIVAQIPRACKSVLEEKYLKLYQFMPSQILGSEGVFGTAAMCLILPVLCVIPGKNVSPLPYNTYECIADAALQLWNTPWLLGMALLYITFAFLYGVVALYITGRLSAVDRTLVDSCRTIFVWVCDLFIYYVISRQYGDPWTSFSWLQ